MEKVNSAFVAGGAVTVSWMLADWLLTPLPVP